MQGWLATCPHCGMQPTLRSDVQHRFQPCFAATVGKNQVRLISARAVVASGGFVAAGAFLMARRMAQGVRAFAIAAVNTHALKVALRPSNPAGIIFSCYGCPATLLHQPSTPVSHALVLPRRALMRRSLLRRRGGSNRCRRAAESSRAVWCLRREQTLSTRCSETVFKAERRQARRLQPSLLCIFSAQRAAKPCIPSSVELESECTNVESVELVPASRQACVGCKLELQLNTELKWKCRGDTRKGAICCPNEIQWWLVRCQHISDVTGQCS